ncbi:MAG: hypothetical protein CMP11_08245, partial [Zetaproteobacteria bacterium]|nr:hypothetical protein [Pseudobdellovibrionaceae bacterium]
LNFDGEKIISPLDADGKVINNIKISGLTRTHESVIYQELLIRKDKIFKSGDYLESVIRIKNLTLFYRVETKIYLVEDNRVTVHFHLLDRWTLVPIFDVRTGGGSKYISFGLTERNILGRYQQGSFSWTQLDGVNSYSLQWTEPRLLKRRIMLNISASSSTRNYSLYDDKVEIIGGFTIKSNSYLVYLQKEFLWWLFWGVGLELNDTSFSEKHLTKKQKLANEKRSDLSFKPANVTTPFLKLTLGRLNYDQFFISGYQSQVQLRKAIGDDPFLDLIFSNKFFWLLPFSSNVGLQVKVGYTSADLIQYQFYLGGLSHVRGYLNNQFMSHKFLQANFENRLALINTTWITLQHVVFSDNLFLSEKKSVSSLGTGIRIRSRRITNFGLRFDYAVPLEDKMKASLSFRVKQFF